MHLFHRWSEVIPPEGRNHLPVTYWQCDVCERRRIDDQTSRRGYRGGADIEWHWLRTGEWKRMGPPKNVPTGSAGVGDMNRLRDNRR